MDLLRRSSRDGYVRRHGWLTLAMLAAMFATASPMAAQSNLFETDAYITITRKSKIHWSLNYDRLVDSLRTVSLMVDLPTLLSLLSDSLDANPRGGSGGIPSDSLDPLMTTGPRKLNPMLVSTTGAASGTVLVNSGGTPQWTFPDLPDKIAAVGWLQSSILPHNSNDTSGHKHVFLWTSLDRELPVAHGTQYSAIAVNLAVRYTNPVATAETFSAIWVSSGGGPGAIQQGDRLIVRFFPKIGTSVDKILKLYRLPDNTPLYNSYYGEEIGTLTVPSGKFPGLFTDQCNLTLTLTYKVK